MEESSGEIDRKLVRELYQYAQTWEELRQVYAQQFGALQLIVDSGANGIWLSTNKLTKVGTGGVTDQTKSLDDIKVLCQSLKTIGTKIDLELVQETTALISRVILNNFLLPCIRLMAIRPTASFRLMKHTDPDIRMRALKD